MNTEEIKEQYITSLFQTLYGTPHDATLAIEHLDPPVKIFDMLKSNGINTISDVITCKLDSLIAPTIEDEYHLTVWCTIVRFLWLGHN